MTAHRTLVLRACRFARSIISLQLATAQNIIARGMECKHVCPAALKHAQQDFS